jgi:hypothetical protein
MGGGGEGNRVDTVALQVSLDQVEVDRSIMAHQHVCAVGHDERRQLVWPVHDDAALAFVKKEI